MFSAQSINTTKMVLDRAMVVLPFACKRADFQDLGDDYFSQKHVLVLGFTRKAASCGAQAKRLRFFVM
jgi:hypothetical protein